MHYDIDRERFQICLLTHCSSAALIAEEFGADLWCWLDTSYGFICPLWRRQGREGRKKKKKRKKRSSSSSTKGGATFCVSRRDLVFCPANVCRAQTVQAPFLQGGCIDNMTVDNVNILLISCAFEVLSGLKAFTIRSLSSPRLQIPQILDGVETLVFLWRPAEPMLFWLFSWLFTNLVMERKIWANSLRSFWREMAKMSLRFD